METKENYSAKIWKWSEDGEHHVGFTFTTPDLVSCAFEIIHTDDEKEADDVYSELEMMKYVNEGEDYYFRQDLFMRWLETDQDGEVIDILFDAIIEEGGIHFNGTISKRLHDIKLVYSECGLREGGDDTDRLMFQIAYEYGYICARRLSPTGFPIDYEDWAKPQTL